MFWYIIKKIKWNLLIPQIIILFVHFWRRLLSSDNESNIEFEFERFEYHGVKVEHWILRNLKNIYFIWFYLLTLVLSAGRRVTLFFSIFSWRLTAASRSGLRSRPWSTPYSRRWTSTLHRTSRTATCPSCTARSWSASGWSTWTGTRTSSLLCWWTTTQHWTRTGPQLQPERSSTGPNY